MNQNEKKAIKYPSMDMLYDDLNVFDNDQRDEVQKDLEEKYSQTFERANHLLSNAYSLPASKKKSVQSTS